MSTPKELPTIPGLPLIGNILEYHHDLLGLFTKMAAHGDMAACKVVGQRLILVNSPALVHELLIDHAHQVQKSDEFMDAADPLVGHGLLTIKEADHKRERGLVASAFTPKAIEAYQDVVLECAEDFQKELKSGDEILIGREMMRVTLRIIGKIIFGVDLAGESAKLWQTFTVALSAMHQQLSALIPLPLSIPTPAHLAYKKAAADLDAIIYEIIAEHRRHPERDDLLARLLKAQSEDDGGFLTDKQIRDEINTMLIAGHETTANALALTWIELAHNPELYARARQEVDEVLQGQPCTAAGVKKLTFLNQVWSEGLRKYPPVYVTDRQALEPFTLGGCELPKDEILIVCPYTLHRRPDVFPDPERFDPERFSAERAAKLPKSSYIPFGEGHRVCVGRWLATMEAVILLADWIQNFTFEPTRPEIPKVDPVLTLRPDPTYKLKVNRR